MQNALADLIPTLKAFFRHPVEEIARLPDWNLKKVLIMQAVIAAASGVIAGFFPPSLWRVLQGLIIFPILVTVMTTMLSCFFYYYFQIFEQRTVSFTRLITLVFFANLPYYLFHIPASYFPPSDLAGLGMTAILLVIGLTENFGLEKKKSLRVIGVIFGLLFILWLGEKIASNTRDRFPDSAKTKTYLLTFPEKRTS